MLLIVCAAVASAIFAGTGSPPGSPSRDAAVAQLLALHEELLEALENGDPAVVMARESDGYVTANHGELVFPTSEERNARAEICPGLQTAAVCEDAIAPVVQVSPDGQLGWVIAQVVTRALQDGAEGERGGIATRCAWVELYERREGRWFRVGSVCNCGPQEAKAP
jgi:hypothetical protein